MKLLESIRYKRNKCQLLERHQARMLRSLQALAPDSAMHKQLKSEGLKHILEPKLKALFAHAQEPLPSEVYKIRLIYDENSVQEVQALPYQPLQIDELYLYNIAEDLDYTHKYLDRKCLKPMAFDGQDSKQNAKIPLFLRDGWLTDTSFSNLVLRIGRQMLTPRQPLLRGVMREKLLNEGIIIAEDLRLEDLERAEEILLINAMLPLERAIRIKKLNKQFLK